MLRGIEASLAVLATVVLLGAGVASVVGPAYDSTDAGRGNQPTSAGRGSSLAFDPPVPREYHFDADSGAYASGVAHVDGRTYGTIRRALDAAESGDTVRLRGWFDATPVVNTSGVTLTSVAGHRAVVDGSAEGNVLTVEAANVTLRRLWIRNAGYDPADNDAAIWVDADGTRIVNVRLTEFTFGIWLDGVSGAYVANNTIVGRERVHPLTMRGNGIQVWKTTDAVIAHNRITDVRDGIYYSFSSHVTARYNVVWDLRYGVHYMYSDHCTLRRNVAFGNDVGWALMVSQHLRIVNNVAFDNAGRSGHGILVKSIDHSVIRGNALVANGDGLYVYNAINDTIVGNLLLANDVGVVFQAGNRRTTVHGNTFVRNENEVHVVTSRLLAWNTSERGNYWAKARVVDLDGDGVSELRYQPATLVAELIRNHPQAIVFAHSPAFDAIRRAQKAFPVVESDGVVDYHPLTAPTVRWRRWYRSGLDWSWWRHWVPREVTNT